MSRGLGPLNLAKEHGNYRDTRIGRGKFASVDVNHPNMRFPIDQVYLTESINHSFLAVAQISARITSP